jgi:argininosuccinate lyase
MTLWGGRFESEMDHGAWDLNASIAVDRRLADQDVRGSLAWASALLDAGVLSNEEHAQISQGLETVQKEFLEGSFEYLETDEDIHSAVERRLGDLIGPLAGKLHTGRSRNDQVALDTRLWLLDHIPTLNTSLIELQSALLWRAESDFGHIMPGYTHLQRAQPILVSHWWLSHFWPIQRDRERMEDFSKRTAISPLGAAALAGTSFQIDRTKLAISLGFNSPAPNSIDAVADRDFIAEFLFTAALIGVHLSKLAEAIVLFSSAEFGFIELSDAFTTGSSLMPQKKNPDVFELARGKSGPLIGNLVSILTTLKGLPSTYDKDLQGDKAPLFQSYDILQSLLPVISNAIRTLTIKTDTMSNAVDPSSMATDLADELVRSGIPFRQAHKLVGNAVLMSQRLGKTLGDLNQEDVKAIAPDVKIDLDFEQIFNPLHSLSARNCVGGSSPEAVKDQIIHAWGALPKNSTSH